MRNLIITSLFLFFSLTNIQAQTYQETVDWLDVKLNEHARTEGNMSYKFDLKNDTIMKALVITVHVAYVKPLLNNYGGAYEIYLFPRLLLEPFYRKADESINLCLKYKQGKKIRCFVGTDLRYIEEYSLQLNKETSEDEKEKIKKAFLHLIKLDGGVIQEDLF